MTTFTTNPVSLKTLLQDVDDRKIQLPEFQRDWVWDDDRIRALLASISRGFPIGAVMTLGAGGDIRYKARLVKGVSGQPDSNITQFLLDGQQRLTSLYQALKYPGPVDTHDTRKKRIQRWYYIDMIKAMDGSDREEAIVSVPKDKRLTADFGRTVVRDLSTPELEYESHMLPTERLFDPMTWMLGYLTHWDGKPHPDNNPVDFWARFNEAVVSTFAEYQLPVISLAQGTSKEAVCAVFEKVNTGGVTLTAFELVTASFAADDFALRDDWDARRSRLHKAFGVLQGIDGVQFLQAVTLLATQQRHREQKLAGKPDHRIGCQKRDILSLTVSQYQTWADKVEEGFRQAAKFLHSQFVFKKEDVPYTTQLVPLAVLHAELGGELHPAKAKLQLERWYWAGVFSEAYGAAIETQYAQDLTEVAKYVRDETPPRLLTEANFNPERLLSLKTRISAAYKGLYALQMKSAAKDWRQGVELTLAAYHDEAVDIHHIFPVAWCEKNAVPLALYDSIINKTPINAETNRRIGGRAPSEYLPLLEKDNPKLDEVLRSHWLNPELLWTDNFSKSFMERGQLMLGLIGEAMGKEVSDERAVFRNALIREGMLPPHSSYEHHAEEEFDDGPPDYDEFGSAAHEEDEGSAA